MLIHSLFLLYMFSKETVKQGEILYESGRLGLMGGWKAQLVECPADIGKDPSSCLACLQHLTYWGLGSKGGWVAQSALGHKTCYRLVPGWNRVSIQGIGKALGLSAGLTVAFYPFGVMQTNTYTKVNPLVFLTKTSLKILKSIEIKLLVIDSTHRNIATFYISDIILT